MKSVSLSFLYMRNTLANFNLLGKIPFRRHWFIFRVTGLLISCFIDFNKLVDIPSFPQLFFEGSCIILITSASFI